MLFGAHLAQILAGRRTDQILLPTVGLLGGIGLLLMERLPQDLAVAVRRPSVAANAQLVWLVLALTLITALAIVVRSDTWLRRYKYTWAAVGIGLLLLVLRVRHRGERRAPDAALGPFSGQPSELLKVILVIFLAGLPVRGPPAPHRASTRGSAGPPAAAAVPRADGRDVGDRARHRRRPARPGRGAPVLRGLPAAAVRATGRVSYVVIGLVLFFVGQRRLDQLLPHVRTRIDIWLDPFADPPARGYQIIQALHAFARGGLLGTGLGAGCRRSPGRPPIPEIHTDFPFAALGEELGLIGVLAILGLYLVVIERGLRIAASAGDDFRSLLAAGLALVIGVQAFIIAAGNLKLIPLTGITLPFISYGGSSLLVNGIVVGLLLALSDKGVEPPPPPRPPSRARRLARRLGA